jgi:hypothetical protein
MENREFRESRWIYCLRCRTAARIATKITTYYGEEPFSFKIGERHEFSPDEKRRRRLFEKKHYDCDCRDAPCVFSVDTAYGDEDEVIPGYSLEFSAAEELALAFSDEGE